MVFRLLLYVNRFYRANFVAAKTPYAAAVINHNPGICEVHGSWIAYACTVAAADANGGIDFRPWGMGIYPPFQRQGENKIKKL